MKRVLVFGWYGHGNCGDESYKIAFPLLFPDCDFYFTRTIKNIDVGQFDEVIVGGGDVLNEKFISPLYNTNLLLNAASINLTSISDLNNLYRFKKILVRDPLSYQLALKYGTKSQCFLVPDFSFALSPNKQNGRNLIQKSFQEANHELKDKVVVVVLNSYISYNQKDSFARDFLCFQNVCTRLSDICEDMDASWIFLPFSTTPPWDDRITSSWLAGRCASSCKKNVVIYEKMGVQDTLDIVSAANAVISSRLHSSIFSTLAGVPFVDITHHDKNRGFMQLLGKEGWMTNFWNFDSEKVKLLLDKFMCDAGHSADLRRFTEKAKEQLSYVPTYLL